MPANKPHDFIPDAYIYAQDMNENFDEIYDKYNSGEVINQNSGVVKMWRGTQAQYDLIITPDPNTIYFIVG